MTVTVIGAGSWGTALSTVFAGKGMRTLLYSRHQEILSLNKTHRHPSLFPETKLSPLIEGTDDFVSAVKAADILLFAVPSKAYRETAIKVSPLLTKRVHIISTAKGFDPESHERLSTVLRKAIGEEKRYPIVSLLGPSYASEVMAKKLTAINAVSVFLNEAKYIRDLLSGETFRVYSSDDEIGSEISAALKNVLAIASGILYGLGQGNNARAALVTRGIKEITRFSLAFGGKEKTFLGLTGIGDVMLTCNSFESRNFYLGTEIGKADSAVSVLRSSHTTTEGVPSAKYAYELSLKYHIDMPITKAVYEVLYEHLAPSGVILSLMKRTPKDE